MNEHVCAETADIEERRVRLAGVYNMRDLGGLVGAGGKRVKRGLILRSADLSTLDPAKAEPFFRRVPLRTIVDFRTERERLHAPDILPPTVDDVHIFAVDSLPRVNLETLTEDEARASMLADYTEFVRDSFSAFSDFLHLSANTDKQPLLFHCAAGKDRTGFAAALLLSALGVEREAIIQDYLLSVDELKGKYDSYVAGRPGIAPLFTVQREYLEAAFATIDRTYGGVEKYLARCLYVDAAKLRAIYLE